MTPRAIQVRPLRWRLMCIRGCAGLPVSVYGAHDVYGEVISRRVWAQPVSSAEAQT